MKIISKTLLKLLGWKYIGKLPVDKKYVIISVPHTSKIDFVWGKLVFASMGESPTIFIKKESFYFPFNIIFKALGAKPVNRQKGALSLLEQVIEYFHKNDKFSVCITPEGTRKPVKRWKKGFYFIAQKANVPIYLGVMDYKEKTLDYGERFIPTGDIKKDMDYIKQYYNKIKPQPKHPERFIWDFS